MTCTSCGGSRKETTPTIGSDGKLVYVERNCTNCGGSGREPNA